MQKSWNEIKNIWRFKTSRELSRFLKKNSIFLLNTFEEVFQAPQSFPPFSLLTIIVETELVSSQMWLRQELRMEAVLHCPVYHRPKMKLLLLLFVVADVKLLPLLCLKKIVCCEFLYLIQSVNIFELNWNTTRITIH